MMNDSMEAIRKYYDVPAYRRSVVRVDGRRGVITGTWGMNLLVMLDGECHSRLCDPHELEYTDQRREPRGKDQIYKRLICRRGNAGRDWRMVPRSREIPYTL